MIRSGNPGAYQQPSNWGRNDSGNFEVWVFEGTPQEIRNAAAYFAGTQGLNYNVQEGFGKWRLEVMFPWNQDGLVLPKTDTIIRWELFAQHAEKDLLTSIDNAGVIKTLSPYQKQQIRHYQLNPPADQLLTVDDFTDPNNPAAGDAANALAVWNLFAAGQSSYLMEAPALRRTIITSLQYAPTYAATYARRLLSTGTIVSFEQVPSLLMSPIFSVFSADVSPDPNLVYGWYKYFPTVQQIALMKWSIVQDWQYGWWSFPYGTPL